MTPAERGSATAEAVLLGVVLMVPLLWLLGVLSQVHAAALAATSGARDAGVAAARAPSEDAARLAAESQAAAALADAGLDRNKAALHLEFSSGMDRGGSVTVEVAYDVAVVSLPLLGSGLGPSVTVRAVHVAPIDPYASR